MLTRDIINGGGCICIWNIPRQCVYIHTYTHCLSTGSCFADHKNSIYSFSVSSHASLNKVTNAKKKNWEYLVDFWKDKNKWSTLKSAKATALTAYQSSVHAVVAKYWNADRSPTDVQILIVCRYSNITHSLENLVFLYIAVHPDTRLLNFFHLQLKWFFFYVSGHRFGGKKKETHEPFRTVSENPKLFC